MMADHIQHVAESVFRLLLSGKPLERAEEPLAVVEFALACSLASLLFWALQGCISFISAKGGQIKASHCVAQPLASGLTGMFALSLDIVQPSLPGCLAVAFSWPAIVSIMIGPPKTEVDPGGGEILDGVKPPDMESGSNNE